MPIIENEYQLSLLSEGAVIRDRMGDVWQLRGEDMWCSFETTPMDSRSVARWLPAEVLVSEHGLDQRRHFLDAPTDATQVQLAGMTGLPMDVVAAMLRAGWTYVMEVGKPTRWERQFREVKRLGRTSQYVPAEQQFPGRTDVLGSAAAPEGGADRG